MSWRGYLSAELELVATLHLACTGKLTCHKQFCIICRTCAQQAEAALSCLNGVELSERFLQSWLQGDAGSHRNGVGRAARLARLGRATAGCSGHAAAGRHPRAACRRREALQDSRGQSAAQMQLQRSVAALPTSSAIASRPELFTS